jgi:hypothetical protein
VARPIASAAANLVDNIIPHPPRDQIVRRAAARGARCDAQG